MNHAITIGGLLQGIGIIVGLVGTVFGALMVFAGGMSDAPQAGEDAGKSGCIVFIGGALLTIGCVLGLVF